MNRYMCSFCGETFDEPHIDRARENLDGENGIWYYDVKTCPLCGSDNIESGVRPCVCGEPIRDGEIVCASCKRKFLISLNAFIDECTAEEVALLDRKGVPADEDFLKKVDNDFCSYGGRKDEANE